MGGLIPSGFCFLLIPFIQVSGTTHTEDAIRKCGKFLQLVTQTADQGTQESPVPRAARYHSPAPAGPTHGENKHDRDFRSRYAINDPQPA